MDQLVTELNSLDDLAAADTGELTIVIKGKPSNWVWTIAGPGHDATRNLADELSKESLHESKMHEQARLNGKKVKVREESVDEVRARTHDLLARRVLAWTPIIVGGADYPCTKDNVVKILANPSNAPVVTQLTDFINADDSFIKRSATN